MEPSDCDQSSVPREASTAAHESQMRTESIPAALILAASPGSSSRCGTTPIIGDASSACGLAADGSWAHEPASRATAASRIEIPKRRRDRNLMT
jgi:hypothetical protein